MKTSNDFAYELQSFFMDYLVRERGSSAHTIRAYRDTFTLLLDYLESKCQVSPDQVTFDTVDRSVIIAFLNWLQDEHQNSVCTRNQRLAAIRSFFKFMMYEDPTRMNQWKSICTIPMKKGPTGTLNYLTVEAVKTILEQIDASTNAGLRNLTMLSLLYNSGARVQELIDLRPLSIRKEKPFVVELFGKGSKKRLIPLEDAMMELLLKYMKRFGLDVHGKETHPLFYNTWGEKLTNPGIAYVIKKYASMARILNPDIIPEKISPHVFRHSRAMHLLQAGVNLVYIRDILGHVSIQTTEIYARADSKQKREALEKAYESVGITEPDIKQWERNPKLRELLKSICK
jgi:site-specific recombinase XerD